MGAILVRCNGALVNLRSHRATKVQRGELNTTHWTLGFWKQVGRMEERPSGRFSRGMEEGVRSMAPALALLILFWIGMGIKLVLKHL